MFNWDDDFPLLKGEIYNLFKISNRKYFAKTGKQNLNKFFLWGIMIMIQIAWILQVIEFLLLLQEEIIIVVSIVLIKIKRKIIMLLFVYLLLLIVTCYILIIYYAQNNFSKLIIFINF